VLFVKGLFVAAFVTMAMAVAAMSDTINHQVRREDSYGNAKTREGLLDAIREEWMASPLVLAYENHLGRSYVTTNGLCSATREY
jgi:hypothetical protein